jgi:hypothetical protein
LVATYGNSFAVKTLDLFNLLASGATAVGVFLAWWQIRESKQQAISAFEDSFSTQYRNLVQQIPVEALLGEDLDDNSYRANLNDFYHYIDLTNEQVFLRRQRRVSPETWKNWCDGIRSIMSKPAFARAWNEISRRAPDSFEELRRLVDSGYADDPATWKLRR